MGPVQNIVIRIVSIVLLHVSSKSNCDGPKSCAITLYTTTQLGKYFYFSKDWVSIVRLIKTIQHCRAKLNPLKYCTIF